MKMKTGRPRRTTPMRRFNLTLDEGDASLLEAYAHEVGQQPTRVAGELFRKLLHGARTTDGRIDRHQVDAMLRVIRGEGHDGPPDEPRWDWPVEAILADRRWWDRWLPDLNELMGRKLTPPRATGDYEHRPEPVLDRRGYADLMEYVFPAITSSRGGAVTWRSPEYASLATPSEPGESSRSLAHVWESVIRHVVTALCALEGATSPGADPVKRIVAQEYITGPWLQTLRYLTGEDQPSALPAKRVS